jgi:hypothetical protein
MKSTTSPSKGKGSRSPLLDSVRRTQTDAQENRTAQRIDELLGGRPVVDRQWQTSPETSMRFAPASPKLTEGSPLLDAVRQTHLEALGFRTTRRVEELRVAGSPNLSLPQYDEAIRSSTVSPYANSALNANLSMKKNITQRRSRGRLSDDGSKAPKSSLLSRRPRSRSKD